MSVGIYLIYEEGKKPKSPHFVPYLFTISDIFGNYEYARLNIVILCRLIMFLKSAIIRIQEVCTANNIHVA